jgi:Uma2 family endonuclease
MTLLQRDTQYHTYADYLTWSRDHGDELINGIAYIREPPSPSRFHQEIVGELHRQVANALEGKSSRAYVAPFDVRLPKSGEVDDEVDTVVQPDVLIVCDRRKVDERGVRGAPDWVAEVLSRTTASHDRTIKLAAYERAGVPEVWLIHPTDRTVTIYRLEAGRYGRAAVLELKGQTPITSVSGITVDWDRLLANIA